MTATDEMATDRPGHADLLLGGASRPVRLSVLDLVPVARNLTPGEALRRSTALARRAEGLG